jgi:hypothetical protein
MAHLCSICACGGWRARSYPVTSSGAHPHLQMLTASLISSSSSRSSSSSGPSFTSSSSSSRCSTTRSSTSLINEAAPQHNLMSRTDRPKLAPGLRLPCWPGPCQMQAPADISGRLTSSCHAGRLAPQWPRGPRRRWPSQAWDLFADRSYDSLRTALRPAATAGLAAERARRQSGVLRWTRAAALSWPSSPRSRQGQPHPPAAAMAPVRTALMLEKQRACRQCFTPAAEAMTRSRPVR